VSVRIGRIVRWALVGLLGLMLVAAGVVWFALTSDSAARRLIALALSKTGNAIQIGRVNGSLGGPLALRNVRVKTSTYSATIDSLLLDWSPTGLIRKEVRIDRLYLVGVHVVLPDSVPRDTTTGASRRPRLPVRVVLGDVRARDITVRGKGGAALSEGTARMTGLADDYRLTAAARATTPQLKAVPFQLRGRGDLEELLLDQAAVDLLDGHVGTAGRVAWWPRVSWNLAGHAERVRPALLLADSTTLPGWISLRARTAGYLDSTGAHGTLAVDSVSGRLRREPVSGTADIGFAGTAFSVKSLDGRWGSAHLVASGTAGDTIALRYRLTVGDLRVALPSAHGELASTGTVAGSRKAAVVRAAFDGRNVGYGTTRIARLSGAAVVGLARSGRTDVRLSGRDARVGTQVVDSLALTVRGTRDDHHIVLGASAPARQLTIAATGGVRDRSWRGTIDSLGIHDSITGDWRLERRATVAASAKATTVDSLCLAADSMRVCAGGTWRDVHDWRVAAALEKLPLTLLQRALPDSLIPGQALAGSASVQLDARAAAGRLDGTLRLGTDHAVFLYQQAPSDTAPKRIVFDTAGALLRMGDSGVRGTMAVRFVGSDRAPIGRLDASFALPRYTRLGRVLKREPVAAQLDAQIVDLAIARAMYPSLDSLTGHVTVAATATGTIGAPRVSGDLQLQDWVAWLAGDRVARGSARATLAGAMDERRHLSGEVKVVPRAVLYEYPLAGVPQHIVVDSGGLDLRAGADGVHGALALGLRDSSGARLASLAGRLDLPQYTTPGAPLGPQAMTFRFTGDMPSIAFFRAATARFDSLTGRMRVDLAATGTVATPHVTGTLRLAQLAARLPSGGVVTGGLEGDLEATVARDSALSASFRLTPRGMAWSFGADSARRRVALADTGVTVRVGRDGMHGALALRVTDDTRGAARSEIGTVSGRLAIPRYTHIGTPLDSQALSARLIGHVNDLALAETFTPQVDSLTGRITLDATVGGTVAAPVVRGGVRLDAPTARLALLGVTYRDVQLAAIGDSSGDFALSGRARSGGGTLSLDGHSPLPPTGNRPALMRIRGTNFEAVNVPELHAIVSPALQVAIAGDSINAQGDVMLPLVHVQLTEVPETAIAPSQDVVFVGDSAPEQQQSAWRIASRIRIGLGDSVSFSGFNFTAALGGQLLLVQQPGRPPMGSGGIDIVEGHYKAYGQDLTISQGHIRFAGGPVDDPSLAIRATRTAQDSVVAGLDIAGTLKRPQVTIFSNPPMSESRALSYIVLGHAPGQTTGAQGDLLSRAATSLGLRGGNLLAKAVGQNLGLSNLSVESAGDVQKASLVAGTYLSPNLYVSYGIGLFDPTSILRLRYDISRRWTLQAERGAATGADLLFRTERGTAAPAPVTGTDTGIAPPP
jgi:autotransporter translocation and assembly factor TamB